MARVLVVSDAGLVELEAQATAAEAILSETQARVSKVERELGEYKKLYALLREENERLKRGLLGQKAEKLPQNDAQLSLAILELMMSGANEPAAPPEEQQVEAHTRQKPKRKPLPAEWPRVYLELVPPEVEREGLDAFTIIGSETRAVLERRPASCVVVEVVRKKFVRKAEKNSLNTEVLIAEPLALPIDKGVAGPGMLAETIVRRWCDHLPLHRQEGIYARDGLDIARSTLCGWHTAMAESVLPLIQAMKADAWLQPYLCTDATGVLVQAPERCTNGHFWVLVAPDKHVLFEFSNKHDSAAVDKLLAGYRGYLVADAHAVYDHLYRSGQVVEVACWAHCRRYFFKSLESDPDRAKRALAYISALFKIERTIADEPRKKKEAMRDKKSRSLVHDLFAWCEAQKDAVLDESPIATAIGYAHQPAKRAREISRRRQVADVEQHLREKPAPASRRPQKLDLRRLRGRRACQHRLRLPHRELRPQRHRALELPPRSLLPVARLAQESRPRARPRLLEADPPAR